MPKYTVRWNQEVVSGDIWRMGEERELTTDQFYFMETTYPGCLVPVRPSTMPEPKEPEPKELRAETAPAKRVIVKAPVRSKPIVGASTKKKG